MSTNDAPQIHAFNDALRSLAHVVRERFARVTPPPPLPPRDDEDEDALAVSVSPVSERFDGDASESTNGARSSGSRRT